MTWQEESALSSKSYVYLQVARWFGKDIQQVAYSSCHVMVRCFDTKFMQEGHGIKLSAEGRNAGTETSMRRKENTTLHVILTFFRIIVP